MHPPSSSLHASQTHAPRGLYFLSLLGLLSFLGLPAAAQTRPLRTTEAEVLPPGTLRAQVGFDFLQEVDFPLSGLTGDLTSVGRSEEHTSELQSRGHLVCRLLLEKKKQK